MSFANLAAGSAVLTVIGSLALNMLLPSPPPIVVHSLVYEAGVILQDRTVTTDGEAFFAQWSAQIMDVSTGLPVPWCRGSGTWSYVPGRKVVRLPLPEWSGRAECTQESLPPGRYYPLATWSWGADQTSHRGEEFGP